MVQKFSLMRKILIEWDNEPVDHISNGGPLNFNDIKNETSDYFEIGQFFDAWDYFVKNEKKKKIKIKTTKDKSVLTYLDKRYVITGKGAFVDIDRNTGKLKNYTPSDMKDTEIFLAEAYDGLPIYIENEAPNDKQEEMALGAFFPNGNNNSKNHPCVVLYRKNIKQTAKSLHRKMRFESLSIIEYNLTRFVLVHELAHAFFSKDGGCRTKNEEIEECLANYAALLHAKKIGGLFLMIAQLFVGSQKKLKNKGYYFALKLFDDKFAPKLTGWWKWRYCCDVKDEKTYKDLSNILDLIEILKVTI